MSEPCGHPPDLLIPSEDRVECPCCGKIWVAFDTSGGPLSEVERLKDALDAIARVLADAALAGHPILCGGVGCSGCPDCAAPIGSAA